MVPDKVITLVLAIAFTIVINTKSCFMNPDRTQKSDLQYLIIGLPLQHNDSELAAGWERGKEILSGAQIAINRIHERPDIFPGITLQSIVVDIGRCNQPNHNFLIQFVNITTFYRKFGVIGAAGIFCPFEMHIIIPQLQHTHTMSVTREHIISAVEATYHDRMILQSAKNIKIHALLYFFDVLNWTTIAVISDKTNMFFSAYVELLYGASVEYGSNIIVKDISYTTNISLLNLPRIVIVSVGKAQTIELLCNAYKLKLMWPKHVWILHTYHLEEFASLDHHLASCRIQMAMENILIINQELRVPIQPTDGKNNCTSSNVSNVSNVYSVILHDLVFSLALEVNHSISGQDTSSSRRSLTRQVRIIQVSNYTAIPIAIYFNGLTFCDPTFINNAPSDKLIHIVEGASFAYTVVFMIAIIAGFVCVTLVLFGYNYFRQEPEVKSTSFSLSLLVFIGCYLYFVYSSILLYFHQPWATSNHTLDALCISLNWFSGLGVSSGLIMVTLLVKTFRIYHIFNKPSVLTLSKQCSDNYLTIYVTLILSPLLLIHIVWTAVDPYLGDIKISAELNEVRYQKQCKSNYTILWYALLVVYMSIIFLILIIVAFKTRKINKSHFKDTKKITMLVVCYFLDIIATLISWRILYTAVNAYLAAIVLHMGHFTALILTQVILFAPKTLPPLFRCINKQSTS